MPKFLEAKASLERLKILEDNVKRAALVLQFNGKCEEAQKNLNFALVGSVHIKVVFPGWSETSVNGSIRVAVKAAKRLHASLKESIDYIDNNKCETAVTSLREYADAAQKTLRNQWQSLVNHEIEKYGRLAAAAKHLGSARADALQRAIGLLRGFLTQPPQTADAAGLAKAALDTLIQTVRELGLEGAAGAFLIAAGGSGASLRDFEKEGVRDFIEKWKLWKLFNVKLE